MLTSFIKNWDHFNVGCTTILVAVSTGVDSMSLLDLLQKLPINKKPNIVVAYVNHKLRYQSEEETDFIIEYCRLHKIPLKMAVWAKNMHPKNGVEDSARKFRYNFFQHVMDENKIKFLVTAHHKDDQAETFLMKLIRGGELRQLVGIQPVRNFNSNYKIIRPLLLFSKKELRQYALDNNIKYFEDETNYNDDVLRNRIRHKIIPKLKLENDQLLKHISDYENQINEALILKDKFISEHINNLKINGNDFNLLEFKSFNKLLRINILKYIFEQNKISINSNQIMQIDKLLGNIKKPQSLYKINKHYYLIKSYDYFEITSNINHDDNISYNSKIKLRLNNWMNLNNLTVGLFDNVKFLNVNDSPVNNLIFKIPYTSKDLYVRHRLPGDYIMIGNRREKLRRFFIDHKITKNIRNNMLLLTNDNNLVYLCLDKISLNLSQSFKNAKMLYIVIRRTKER